MHRVARLVLAVLVAQTATAFVLPQRHYSSSSFQLGAVLSSQTAARDIGVKIFDNESAIRTAYDDWRVEFGKGAFDENRYEQFKQNFKTLTVANLEAIEKAAAAGTNLPGWMYLNEYGDFSQTEYNALTVESDVDTYKVYEDWCEEFEVKADANRYEIFLANYKSMKSYAKKTGKNLKLNKYADWTKSEAENGHKEVPEAVVEPQNQHTSSTTVEPAANKQMKEFIQQRGTRVLQYANGVSSSARSTPPRSTIAIGNANFGATPAYPNQMRGTPQVTSTGQQGTRRVGGEQPVASQPSYGTKRITPPGQSSQGTRKITSVSGMGQGTRVIQRTGASQPPSANQPFQGTRAIQPATPNGAGQIFHGTRAIQPATPNGAGQIFHGTRAIQPASPGQSFQGTRKISSVTQGTRAIQPANGHQPFQGTRAIQPAGRDGASQPFQGTRRISAVNGYNLAGEQPLRGTRRISDIMQQRPFRGTYPLNQPPKGE